MIPQNNAAFEYSELSEQPTRTYRVDFESGRVSGFSDGIEAMKQAVFLILNTERFKHLIYSWSYGNELSSVFGKDMELAKSEIKRIITEALTQDERITAVEGFDFRCVKRGELEVSFNAITKYGIVQETTEVAV